MSTIVGRIGPAIWWKQLGRLLVAVMVEASRPRWCCGYAWIPARAEWRCPLCKAPLKAVH